MHLFCSLPLLGTDGVCVHFGVWMLYGSTMQMPCKFIPFYSRSHTGTDTQIRRAFLRSPHARIPPGRLAFYAERWASWKETPIAQLQSKPMPLLCWRFFFFHFFFPLDLQQMDFEVHYFQIVKSRNKLHKTIGNGIKYDVAGSNIRYNQFPGWHYHPLLYFNWIRNTLGLS